jgi:hypothetical protein
VKQANMRINAFDDFAVQLKNKTQDTVSSRMLRAKIDGEGSVAVLRNSSVRIATCRFVIKVRDDFSVGVGFGVGH